MCKFVPLRPFLGKDHSINKCIKLFYHPTCIVDDPYPLLILVPLYCRNNSEAIVGIGLNLVTVAIESGSSHLCQFTSLSGLVQDNLCKYLLHVRNKPSPHTPSTLKHH